MPKNRIAALAIFDTLGDDDYKTITEYKEFIVGVEPSVELPFAALATFAEPKLLNLLSSQLYIVPVVSMTHIRFFWSYVHLDHASWKERRFVNSFEWATDEELTKDADKIRALLTSITDGFETFIIAALKSKWGKAVAGDGAATSEDDTAAPPAKNKKRQGRRVIKTPKEN